MDELLAKGAEVNARTNDGRAALIQASQNGRLGVMLELLAKGAQIKSVTNVGLTAPNLAPEGGQPYVVQALLDKGVDVNASYYNGFLHFAAKHGGLEAVKMLMDHRAQINA